MRNKKKIALVFLISVLSIVFCILNFPPKLEQEFEEYHYEDNIQGYNKNDTLNLKDSQSISLIIYSIDNILIYGNDWEWAKNQSWCSGNGTQNDPYIIENFFFDGNETYYGLRIRDSNKYFRISNCTFAYSRIGLSLRNVQNGLISNNSFLFNEFYGIQQSRSDNNTISNNTFIGNSYYGIELSRSGNNMILNNTIFGSFYDGIALSRSDNNTISNNTIFGNFHSGIDLYYSNQNNISYNNISNNEFSIRLVGNSNNNSISFNVIINSNYSIGVGTSCSGNIIENNVPNIITEIDEKTPNYNFITIYGLEDLENSDNTESTLSLYLVYLIIIIIVGSILLSTCYLIRSLNFSFSVIKEFRVKEFQVNKYLTLKLEHGHTVLYVCGKVFRQCITLLVNIPEEKIKKFNFIDSIDELNLKKQEEIEDYYEYEITPDEEFQGHCSNLQAWVESGYDTRLLHSNLAFPLLRKLTNLGDPQALVVIRAEIIKRFERNYVPVIEYLIEERFLNYLKTKEIEVLITEFNNSRILEKILFHTIIQSFYALSLKVVKKVLKLFPDKYMYWKIMGDAFNKRKNLDKALFCYKQYLEKMPNYDLAWKHVGWICTKKGELYKKINPSCQIGSKNI